MVDKKVFKDALVKFRFGITDMCIHKHRHEAIIQSLCPLCQEEDEDEYHILIRCPAVSDLRIKYLVPHVQECLNVFVQLMGANEQSVLRAVCTYLYHVMKWRENAISGSYGCFV